MPPSTSSFLSRAHPPPSRPSSSLPRSSSLLLHLRSRSGGATGGRSGAPALAPVPPLATVTSPTRGGSSRGATFPLAATAARAAAAPWDRRPGTGASATHATRQRVRADADGGAPSAVVDNCNKSPLNSSCYIYFNLYYKYLRRRRCPAGPSPRHRSFGDPRQATAGTGGGGQGGAFGRGRRPPGTGASVTRVTGGTASPWCGSRDRHGTATRGIVIPRREKRERKFSGWLGNRAWQQKLLPTTKTVAGNSRQHRGNIAATLNVAAATLGGNI